MIFKSWFEYWGWRGGWLKYSSDDLQLQLRIRPELTSESETENILIFCILMQYLPKLLRNIWTAPYMLIQEILQQICKMRTYKNQVFDDIYDY